MNKKLEKYLQFDKQLVKDLDDEVLTMAITIFLNSNSTLVTKLNPLFLNKNIKEVKQIAHKLSGAALSVGLKNFSDLAKSIELSDNITLNKIETITKAFELLKTTRKINLTS